MSFIFKEMEKRTPDTWIYNPHVGGSMIDIEKIG